MSSGLTLAATCSTEQTKDTKLKYDTRPFYLKFQSCGLCLFDLLWPLWEFFGGEIKNSCSPQCIWIELTLSDFTGFQPWIYLGQGICQDKFSHVYLSQYHSTLNYAHPTRRSSQQVLPADLAESCFPASLTIFQLSHVLWPPPSTTFCVYQTTFVCLFLPEWFLLHVTRMLRQSAINVWILGWDQADCLGNAEHCFYK